MIKYSMKVKRLYSKFFSYRNDVDIYTEDEQKDKEFYNKLFSRLLNGSDIRIKDITPLGCKQNVIDRCKEEPESDRKKIFIVDGDIDLIFDNNEKGINNLFVLDAYCIENLIIDETSSTEFLYLNIGTETKENINKNLNFEKWLHYNSEALIDLFLHFSISKEIGQNFMLYNANRFTKVHKKETVLDIDAIVFYTNEVKTEILDQITQAEYEELIKKRKERWPNTSKTLLTIVSGKDYLLPLLQFRIQKFKSLKGLFSLEALKLMLAEHCNLDRLERLKVEILK